MVTLVLDHGFNRIWLFFVPMNWLSLWQFVVAAHTLLWIHVRGFSGHGSTIKCVQLQQIAIVTINSWEQRTITTHNGKASWRLVWSPQLQLIWSWDASALHVTVIAVLTTHNWKQVMGWQMYCYFNCSTMHVVSTVRFYYIMETMHATTKLLFSKVVVRTVAWPYTIANSKYAVITSG